MTLETANTFLNAVTCLVVLVGFFWVKNIQTAHIGSLGAVIKEKDARISRLESDAAPAIAKDYVTLREYANERAEDAQRVTRKLEAFTEGHFQLNLLVPAQTLLSEARGIKEAYQLLDEPLRLRGECTSLEDLVNWPRKIIEAYDKMLDLVGEKNQRAEQIFETAERTLIASQNEAEK